MKPKYKHQVRICIGKDAEGKYKYKRFTEYGDTPKQAQRAAEATANEWLALHKGEMKDGSMTLYEAYTAYIDSKRNVLSPSSINTYQKMQKRNLKQLMKMKINSITQNDVQIAINEEAASHSPKTVRCTHGLLSAVFKQYRPDFVLHTTLPQKHRFEIYIPSNEDVQRLMNAADAETKKIIILAAIGSLRASEICGLRYDDISDDIVTIRRVMVESPSGGYVIKEAPKSDAGFRSITIPKDAIKSIGIGSGNVVSCNPKMAYKHFCKALKAARLPHFRLHDLRHYQASILHAIGVPDKYIMERGGWKTDSTLKNIYQHTMNEKRQEVEKQICEFFDSKFDFNFENNENT